MTPRDVSVVISDYKTLLSHATPDEVDAIDAEFWGSIILPRNHYPHSTAMAERARAAIREKAKNGDSEEGSDRPQAVTATKRAKS